MRKGEGWGKAERICKRRQFQTIQRKGRKIASESLTLLYLDNALPYARFGLTVSKRVGNAVVRNRVKRRLRESLRRNKRRVKGCDIVIIAKAVAAHKDFAKLDNEVIALLTKLNKAKSANIEKKNLPAG